MYAPTPPLPLLAPARFCLCQLTLGQDIGKLRATRSRDVLGSLWCVSIVSFQALQLHSPMMD